MAQEKSKDIFHTTRNGYKLKIKSIPPHLMDKASKSIEWPEIPMYETETAGGEIEYHPHDETTLETPEDKKAWADYQTALEKAQDDENERMMKVILLKGIDIELKGKKFEDWKEEQEYLGIELPTSKPALKVHYIETEILGDNEDIIEIMSKVIEASGVSPEVVQDAKESFRLAVSGNTLKELEVETGEMES